MKVFIYALIDPRDSSVFYVGKTNDPARRLRHHIKYNKGLPKSKRISEITESNLEPVMQILEETTPDKWEERERHYISVYGGTETLTNVQDGGGQYPDWTGKHHSRETKEKIALANTGKAVSLESKNKMRLSAIKRGAKFPSALGGASHAIAVYVYSLSGKYLYSCESMSEAEYKTGVHQSMISRCCRNEIHRAGEYMFSFDFLGESISPFRYVHDKEVYKYSVDGELIEKYFSVKEAAKANNISASNISAVANGNGKQKTAGGYIWKYENTQDYTIGFDVIQDVV